MASEPLRLFLLAHPKSLACQTLAEALMRLFVEPPASGGLRIPTRFTPDCGTDLPPSWEGARGINLDASEHTLVVILADARMLRDIKGGTGTRWKDFFQEGLRRVPTSTSQHYVFGMAVDSDGFGLADREHMISLSPYCPELASNIEEYKSSVDEWVKQVVDDAALQITVRAIQKLEPKVKPTLQRAPLQLFLSHAKADLSPDEQDPVRLVENAVKELPVDYWFDAAQIPPSADFEHEISKGIQDCSILVSFLTDQYSSRTWCQREVMDAKRLGVPVIVVDALREGEPRHFPYIGNVPVVHWRSNNPKQEARRVVSHAARETLRYIHNRKKLSGGNESNGGVVLATAPEALTVANLSNRSPSSLFLYPDPPISAQEMLVIRTLLPSATFTTPLSILAREAKLDGKLIAVSISNSGDLASQGLCELHEQTLSDEICLYLLLSGCRIAYGGALSPQIQSSSNFTLRLFEIVRSYSTLSRSMTGTGLPPIVNYAPWPLRLSYDDRTLKLFGNVATLIEGDRPSEIPESDDQLFPQVANQERELASDTSYRRIGWARGLTAMRIRMTEDASARVVIGGRVAGFAGLYPGIFEEAWMSLIVGRPLYLCGAFGGAAQALIQAIVSGEPASITQPLESKELADCVELAEKRGMNTRHSTGLPKSDQLVTGVQIAADFCAIHSRGIAASLHNGLTDDENYELFDSSEPTQIVDLILRGLSRLSNN